MSLWVRRILRLKELSSQLFLCCCFFQDKVRRDGHSVYGKPFEPRFGRDTI